MVTRRRCHESRLRLQQLAPVLRLHADRRADRWSNRGTLATVPCFTSPTPITSLAVSVLQTMAITLLPFRLLWTTDAISRPEDFEFDDSRWSRLLVSTSFMRLNWAAFYSEYDISEPSLDEKRCVMWNASARLAGEQWYIEATWIYGTFEDPDNAIQLDADGALPQPATSNRQVSNAICL